MKKGQKSWLMYTGGLFMILFCAAFFGSKTTDKSMIRAILLEQTEGGWSAGLLYQAPEASADTSKASAEIRFCRASGETVTRAIEEAEGGLPQTADYRLCDHLLLGEETGWKALDEAERFILSTRQGRIAAFVVGANFKQEELEQEGEEKETLLSDLLYSLKELKAVSPRLYESRGGRGLVLPLLSLGEGRMRISEEGALLTPKKRVVLDKNQLQACYLLTEKGGTRELWREGEKLILPWGMVSVSVEGKGSFSVRLDARIQTEKGEWEIEKTFLETLLGETLEMLWEEGVDLLDLSARQALKLGERELNQPPILQITAKFYPL